MRLRDDSNGPCHRADFDSRRCRGMRALPPQFKVRGISSIRYKITDKSCEARSQTTLMSFLYRKGPMIRASALQIESSPEEERCIPEADFRRLAEVIATTEQYGHGRNDVGSINP